MSVLIMGLKMQKEEALKIAIRDGIASVYLDEGKADYYSVIELPDHGDLVDRDKLMMKMWEASAYAPNHCSWVNARVVFAKDIEDALVVIPAEMSEEEAIKRWKEVSKRWNRRVERSEDGET